MDRTYRHFSLGLIINTLVALVATFLNFLNHLVNVLHSLTQVNLKDFTSWSKLGKFQKENVIFLMDASQVMVNRSNLWIIHTLSASSGV